MTTAKDLSAKIGEHLRRIGGNITFTIVDALVSQTESSASQVRLINNRLAAYAVTQGLTRVARRDRVVYRGLTGVPTILLGITYTQHIQDTYENTVIRWPAIETGELTEKVFDSGYFPVDYDNAVNYCREMFDEAILLPAPSFTEFLRAGTRYHLDLENVVQDKEVLPF